MPESLHLGDLDDIEMLQGVESAFAVKITNAEAEQLHTVGQLFDLLEAKRPTAGLTPACLSQAAFYRLRRALIAMGSSADISPCTPLSAIEGIEPRSIAKKWRLLSERSGLELPRLETPFVSCPWLKQLSRLTLALLFLCCFAVAHRVIGLPEGQSGVAATIACAILFFSVAGAWHAILRRIPRRLITVGDLAREAAGYSFKKLLAQKSGCAKSDRWFALTALLRLKSGHKPVITRDTAFFTPNATRDY